MNSVIDFAKIPFQNLLHRRPIKTTPVIGWLLLAAIAVFVPLNSAVASSVNPPQSKQTSPNHGPIDLLRIEFIQARDAADFLRIADRRFENGDQDAAFNALQAVFESLDSDYLNVDQQKGNASVYEQGISRLAESSFNTRMAWSKKFAPLAMSELQNSSHDDELLRMVARKYPLTESGLTAQLLLIRNMISRQQIFTATESISRLEERYSNLTTPFAARNLIDIARRQIDKAQGQLIAPDSVPGGLAIADHEAAIDTWQPVWQWHENVWNTPQIASTFGAVLQPESRTDLTSNSWQPAVDGDRVFQRTPTRIVCLDVQSGKELWWLPTDTFSRDIPNEFSPADAIKPSPRSTTAALQMSDLGTLSVCPDYVFFVDHYRDFQKEVSDLYDISRFRPLSMETELTSNADRLVAICRTDPPSVAWTAGSVDEFEYEINRPSDQIPAASEGRANGSSNTSDPPRADESKAVTNPFRGHRFLGPPVVFEQRLFALSADHKMIWLNCLAKGTGRLLYRQMIADIDAPSHDMNLRFRSERSKTSASLIGIHDGNLLCLLNRGLVIAASISDGRFQWATSLSNESQKQQVPSSRYRTDIDSKPDFLPVLHNGRLIWSALGSQEISCLNCQTGAIEWQIPRVSDSPGQADQSEDLLPAGIANEQLIVTGERHVRSISIADGRVNWTTGINGSNGKAVLANQTCWVPTLSGMITPIDLATGRRGLPVNPPRFITGSLFQAGNRIIAATPISLEAYPLLPPKPQTAPTTQPEESNGVISALLNANRSPEQILRTLSERSAQLTDLSPHQQSLLTDRILSADVPSDAIATFLSCISQLTLTDEQTLRRQILLGDQTPIQRSEATVKLNSEWWVRSDLAATTFNRPLAPGDSGSDVSHIIRQPLGLQADLLQQQGLTFSDIADRLTANRPEAAELALLKLVSRESDQGQRQRLLQRLHDLRNASLVRGNQSTAKTDPVFDKPLTFNVEENLHLTMVRPMNQFPQLTREPIIIQTHSSDHGNRLFLQERKLFAVNLHRGSVAKSLRLPASVDQLQYTATPPSPTTPSVLPLVDQTHVAAVSLVNPAEPKTLWKTRWERAPFDNSPLRSGPVTPSGMIFATNHRITCLHPLTGHLLWRRDFSTGMAESTFLPVARMAANESHLVSVSQRYQSGTVFRLTDGQQIRTLKYNLPPGVTPVVSGCHMLYPESNILKLIDLTSGKDLLQDSSLAIQPSSTTRLIDRDRAVILTANKEIAVLNLKTAQLESATELSADLLPKNTAGFQAFEEHGRLFVSLRRWDGRDRLLSGTSAIGDRRMTSGTLISIDLKNGQFWSAQNPNSVLMEVAGDPSPLMLLWSRQSAGSSRDQLFNRSINPGIGELDSLLLRILDRRTGRELLRTDNLSWANPLRCVHDSESRMITIETDATEIKLRYTATEPEAK